MGFKDRLEELLKAKYISQKELAEIIGLRRSLISEWKRNNSYPYADVAVKIAEILDTTVEYLITGKDIDKLSLDERELINKYKRLSGDNQRNVKALLDSMLSVPSQGEKEASA